MLILQIAVTVLLPVSVAVLVFFLPGLKALAAAIGLLAVVLDAALLDRLQKDAKKTAARIQELFDCTVLALDWNQFSSGDRPEPETVHDAAGKGEPASNAKLKDWYPPIVGEVPEHLGRIICQRTNVVYDSQLRRRFGNATLTMVIGASVILFVVGVVLRLPLDELMLTVVAPAVPVLVWGIREYYRQGDAADTSDRLRRQAQALWDAAAAGRYSEEQCTVQSRLLQNAIYERRSSAPLVLEWVYRWLRPRLEPQMNASAEELVRTVLGQN